MHTSKGSTASNVVTRRPGGRKVCSSLTKRLQTRPITSWLVSAGPWRGEHRETCNRRGYLVVCNAMWKKANEMSERSSRRQCTLGIQTLPWRILFCQSSDCCAQVNSCSQRGLARTHDDIYLQRARSFEDAAPSDQGIAAISTVCRERVQEILTREHALSYFCNWCSLSLKEPETVSARLVQEVSLDIGLLMLCL